MWGSAMRYPAEPRTARERWTEKGALTMHNFLTCSLLLAASAAAQNNLTPKETADGWILLFDGKSLNGWDKRATSVPNVTGDWAVENGAILCGGKGAGWLSTTASFSDYELKLEFRGSE